MTTLTIGKRLIPIEQAALVIPYVSTDRIKSEKHFKSRVIMLDRESVLSECEPEDFAKANGFRWLMEDQVAANPAVSFGVEGFVPDENFKPEKPYRSRLLWRDGAGQRQSVLMVAEPSVLLAIAVRGEQLSDEQSGGEAEPVLPRRRSRRRQPALQT